MKLLSVILFVNIFVLHALCADKDPDAPPEPFTSEAPTSTSSTTISPTTVTTTTAKPTNATVTTTTKTTTTAKTTTTTTTTTPKPAPTTSTPTVAPTTAPPTPAPKPSQGTWFVTNSTNNETCILLKMAAIIDFNYANTDNKTGEGQVNIPDKANSSGSCGEVRQYINITWPVFENLNNSLQFVFIKNNSKVDLENIFINVVLDPVNFPNAQDANKTYSLNSTEPHFVIPETMSYKCDKQTELPLNITSNNATANVTIGTLKVTLFQFQAFGTRKDQKFAEAKDCEPYETPDIVPIAVGCALMALIIIVLIGYLIGRRRNQARGYLSM